MTYAIAQPFAILAASAAVLAGCAWLMVARALRKTKAAAFQAGTFVEQLEIAALLTGVTFLLASVGALLS